MKIRHVSPFHFWEELSFSDPDSSINNALKEFVVYNAHDYGLVFINGFFIWFVSRCSGIAGETPPASGNLISAVPLVLVLWEWV